MRIGKWLRRTLRRCGLPTAGGPWLTIAAVVFAIEVGLSIVLWDWLNDGESASTTIRNIGFVIAGSVALPLAIWRGLVADKQASAAQRQVRAAQEQASAAQRQVRAVQEQAGIAQKSLLNERYQKGAEMLGDDTLSVRLGGIYALERLAAEHPEQYHVQVMKLLCAFARHPTEDEDYQRKLAEHNADPHNLPSPREDVMAAIEAIGSRDDARVEIEKNQDFRLNLMGVDLSHAQIGDKNLSGAMLNRANLTGTNIFSVNLSNAFLLRTIMKDARLNNVDFTDARAQGVDLTNARVDQHEKPLFSLDGSKLYDAQLYEVDLSGELIQRAHLDRVRITYSDLSGARFLHSHLPEAEISESNLAGARIVRTDLSGAKITGTNLSGTCFYARSGEITSDPVTGLTQAQLDEACADPDNPPKLDGVVKDAKTGKPLVWRGKPCKDD